MLDLSALEKAIIRLDEGITRLEKEPHDTQLRDGLIQRFEFTYELCHKTLRRYLEQSAATPGEFDSADFQYVIRSANEQGLLRGDWPAWRRYRDMRARTSHTYDERVAQEVAAGIPDFALEAHFLFDEITRRHT